MINNKSKLNVFSGVQPSGNLHIGNYLGAISQWVDIQEKSDCIFCVVDYHAITVKQNPDILRKKIIEVAKIYIALGINPEKSIIFQQSDVKEHVELAWILNCAGARISDLNKMTQFKDKAGENQENVSVGLYDYPVLMASDILLYNTDVVPVGDDQLQHVELARDLAKRFNHNFGEVFKVPKAEIRKEGARIMGLDDPTKKMSKSAKSELNFIGLTDDPLVASKKIMRAATDSDMKVQYDLAEKPGISNLLLIYSLLADKKIKDIEEFYKGKGYGDFKKDLAEEVKKFLINFQNKYKMISDDDVRQILDDGAKKIRPIAEETVLRVKKAIGVK